MAAEGFVMSWESLVVGKPLIFRYIVVRKNKVGAALCYNCGLTTVAD
jgi:hypothetical protein